MQLHRGRLLDHIQLRCADLAASRRFYGAIFGILGVQLVELAPTLLVADELCLSPADGPVSRIHIAFQTAGRDQVDGIYAAGLAAGGRDNGGPGERHYHPGYYAAFMLDPDGNNIEAVYHGVARRSAPSVVIDVP
jgi:catechol 2,3-dioxygenase-like lactoylglutathione lyase family enzyme